MKDLSIPIYHHDRISSAFVRANSSLILENFTEFEKIQNDDCRNNLLFLLWKEKYNAVLLKKNNVISDIQFDNDHDKMMFLMKWAK